MHGTRPKLLAAFLFVLMLVPSGLLADSRSIVGFVDLSEVVRAYFRESYTLKEIQLLYERLAQVDAELEFELSGLQDQMSDIPLSDADAREELRDQMDELRVTADEQRQNISSQIAYRQNSLLGSEDFARELSAALDDVATSGGFAMILPINLDDSYWYNPDNIVTRDVIEQLIWLRDRRLQ